MTAAGATTNQKQELPGMRGERERFVANAAANAAYTGAQAFANLWLTSFLVAQLGMAAYGMVPLVASITAYFAILTTAFDAALSRFLVLDIEQGDVRAENETFNTALFSLVGVILALVPLVWALTLGFPALFHAPVGQEQDARLLFVLVAVASFVTILGSSFAVSPFVHSRFVLINAVNFLGLVIRLGTILFLFAVLPSHMWYAGGATLASSLVCLLGFIGLWRKFTPELAVNPLAFSIARLRPLFAMGSWTIVNTAGGILLSRVDLLLVNAFFGAAMTGAYGSLAQFGLLMDYLASAGSTALRPIILFKYAQADTSGLQRLAAQSIKLMGLALALPVGLLCGFASPLIAAWLGESYAYLGALLVVTMFFQSVDLAVRPLLFVQTAYNKIRWPGIVTLFSGFVSVLLAILAVVWCHWGVIGIAFAFALTWTAKNVFYVPIYTAHIMHLPWWTYIPSLVPVLLATGLLTLASYGLTVLHEPHGWLELALQTTTIAGLYMAFAWKIGLNRDDRRLILSLVHSGSQRGIHRWAL